MNKKMIRIIGALMAILGVTFMAGENPHASDYMLGCGTIIFATFLVYAFGFDN